MHKRERYLILLILACFNISSVFSRAENPNFLVDCTYTYEIYAQYFELISVIETEDPGFLILGQAYDMAGSSYCLIKTDTEGRETWLKIWGGDFHIYCEGTFLLESEVQTFFLIGFKKYAPNGMEATKLLEVYHINENGNIIDEKRFNYEESSTYVFDVSGESFEVNNSSIAVNGFVRNLIWYTRGDLPILTTSDMEDILNYQIPQSLTRVGERIFFLLNIPFFVD